MSDVRGRDPGVVTFDGPAASGKSTVAERVAAALGVPCVSSGLLYRVATLLATAAGAVLDDADAVLSVLEAHAVELRPGLGGDAVRVDGDDVTGALHSDAVDAAVSRVAAHPPVRAWVDARLREMPRPFVIDGRDMGSVVFPDAAHKFYLTAAPEVRAARRVGERAADLAEVAEAIRRRDALDARQLAPAPDAQHLDTSTLELEQVVAWVLGRLSVPAAP
ncbi:MAG: (d)CMP kinase [Trueperaceae bacterium]